MLYKLKQVHLFYFSKVLTYEYESKRYKLITLNSSIRTSCVKIEHQVGKNALFSFSPHFLVKRSLNPLDSISFKYNNLKYSKAAFF